MKKVLFAFLVLCSTPFIYAQETGSIEGLITNENNEPIPFATIQLKEAGVGAEANVSGVFSINNVPASEYTIIVSSIGYKTARQAISVTANTVTNITITLSEDALLDEVEVFGDRYKRAEKIEALTRLPLAPNEQLQSISVLSHKLIEQQGALTISDVTKNVAGVYTFATYGNTKESMSLRGFRGIPILKNGVRINSDFRGVGVLTDMAGVDNIQILKGISAISQGLGTDLGSAGGVINIATKTPKFHEGGEISFRTGSFGRVRPAFDFYGPLNEKQNIAFRINGSYDRADSYRTRVNSERLYINPSLAWKPDDKTTIIVEMDYLTDGRTPDQGTINLGGYDTNNIYKLPNDQFVGFASDRQNTKNTTYAIRFDRKLTDKIDLKAGYFSSELDLYTESSYLTTGTRQQLPALDSNQRYRTYYADERADNNSVLQIDVVGKNIKTGFLSHTFQVGVDHRTSEFNSTPYNVTYPGDRSYVDIIDVFTKIPNELPQGVLVAANPDRGSGSQFKSYGFVIQDKVGVTDWLDVFLGLRYTSMERTRGNFIGRQLSGSKTDDALNPLVGFNVKPTENITVFGSYASSSDPRTSFYTDNNGEELGTERWDQFESGIKSTWLEEALRFNVTLFLAQNKNLNLQVVDDAGNGLGYYQQGGEDVRQGVEVELIGRVLPNLQLIAGYSYLDAKYKDHQAYYFNSRPLNTPEHTANAWARYSFENKLEGLSLGVGAYYLGERPHNVWSRSYTHAGVEPGVKPFDLEAYTTVNIQASYRINEHFNIDFLVDNIFNETGFNAYRTAFINRINPATISTILTYRF
ncbi:TonB-dependent receptor [Aquimarina sp. TRL1]|uniref:TonB-dependent receptor n=1 Tax=Aquimarina sp. (strain TRL1) TaxID=2736252 RepID=UPI00158DDB09|nr:TonB-dependent receptor [Aquimarina sp. TRL1]QKX05680.1 TonB-dependent receptor [Aquimarina sp. TRL1]